MKKISVFLTVMIGFVIFGQDVNAACGAGVYVGDEQICLVTGFSGSNAAGTAYSDSSILILDNYNGGSIKFFSGLGNSFGGNTIKLVGDNYITVEDGYGLLVSTSGVNFIGDGSLTIKSKRPIVSIDFDSLHENNDNWYFEQDVTTITIKAGENGGNTIIDDETDKTLDNENKVNENLGNENENIQDDEIIEKEQDLNLNSIVLLGSMGISVLLLLIIIILLVKNNGYKKMV